MSVVGKLSKVDVSDTAVVVYTYAGCNAGPQELSNLQDDEGKQSVQARHTSAFRLSFDVQQQL